MSPKVVVDREAQWVGDVRCQRQAQLARTCDFCGRDDAGHCYLLTLVFGAHGALIEVMVCEPCAESRIGRQLRQAANLMDAPEAKEGEP